MKRIVTYIVLGLLIFTLFLSGCGQQKITVASKQNTEGAILAQLIIELLRAEVGYERVIDKTWMGSTEELREAIINGDIDIYPEYTGNGAKFFEAEPDNAAKWSKDWWNADEAHKKIIELENKARNNLVWLRPAPANNTWAIALNKKVAKKKGLRTMEQFADYVNKDGNQVLVYGSEEFFTSPMALRLFEKKYEFSLDVDEKRIVSSPIYAEHLVGKLYNDEEAKIVYAAMAYRTDGYLSECTLLVLEDKLEDKPKPTETAQPVYAPAPVIRREVYNEIHNNNPNFVSNLEKVFKLLDNDQLRKLNADADFVGGKVESVARDYLTKLVKDGDLPKGIEFKKDPIGQLPTNRPTPELFKKDDKEQEIDIVNTMITVEPGTFWQTEFYVDGDFMSNMRVAGWFKASGGAFNDIKILVLNDVDFTNWQNFYDVKGVVYQSDKITKAEIKSEIREPGSYHLVLCNRFSEFSSKTVLAKAYLYYQDQREGQTPP